MVLTPRYAGYLISATAADMATPIFSIFLPLFAAGLGASAFELGLVGGASYGVYCFLPFVMGHFSDRSGSRSFFIITSLALLGIVSVLYSVTNDPVTLITVRVFEGVGWSMLWPAMDAAVSEDTARDSKSSLAIYNYLWSGGAAVGPFFGTFLVTTFSYRSAFFATGILFGAVILLNGVAYWRERNHGDGKNDSEPAHRLPGTGPLDIRPVFRTAAGESRGIEVWTALVTIGLVTLSSLTFYTFFGPYASSIGMAVVLIGVVTATFGVVRFVVFVVLANRKSLRDRVFDTRNRVRNLVAFAGMASLSSLLLVIKDPTGLVYFLAFGILGIGFSVVYAVSQATLIAEAAPEQRGAAAGLFESSLGVGGVIGPIMAGVVSSSKSLSTAFVVPAASLGFVLVLLLVLFSVRRRSRS